MYSETEQSERFQVTNQDCKRLVTEMLSKIEPLKRDIIIPAGQHLDSKEHLYLLKEGTLAYHKDGKVLFNLDEGDIVGLDERDNSEEVIITAKFAVRVDQYEKRSFSSYMLGNSDIQQMWNSFLSKQLSLYVTIISSLFRNVIESKPKIKHYQANDLIIEQGSITTDVYTVVQGSAQVIRDGKNIGTIVPEQVFGSYAALSGSPCNASVIANDRCLVLSIDRLEFIEMLRNKKLDYLAIFAIDNKFTVL